MSSFLRNTLLGMCCLFGLNAAAQNVSINILPATQLGTCGAPGDFRVIIQNTSGVTLTGITIVPELATGVQYVPGSVGGGFTEQNITQLDSVTFGGVNLAPGQRDTLTWRARAICGAVPGAVIDRINVYHSQGGDVNFSPPYQILRPSLSIQSVSNASFSGPIGSVFSRCVTVVNGGFGPLSQLGIVVGSDPASLQNFNFTLQANGAPLATTVQGNNILIALGTSQIQQVGDGDTLLEQNETLTICYSVRVLDCADLTSAISTNWGCGGSICESQTSTANVVVPTLVPNIISSRIYTENRCPGNGVPSIIRIILRNTGSGPARDVEVDVWQGEPTGPSSGYISRLDTANMLLRSSINGVQPIAAYYVENQQNSGLYACLGSSALRRIRIRIPLMQAGERDTLVIEQFGCCKTWCASSPETMNRSYYQVGYQDQCRTNSYNLATANITGYNFGRVVSFTNMGLTDIPLGDTAQYTIEHSDFRFFNINPGGFAWVDIVAQPGLTVLSSPGSVFFRDIQGDLWNPTSIIRNGDTVRAFFNLNQPANFDLEKAELVFRATNDCSGGPCSSGPKTVRYAIYQKADPSCACTMIVGCHNFVINTHCGICPATCTNGGMIFMRFDAYRKNYGLPDNDNNGLPDAAGSIDMTRVRTQHLMLRDTLYTRFQGVVQTTGANPDWSEAFARSTITRGNVLTPVTYTVRIWDASTGATYNCNLPAPTITSSGTTRTYRYNLNVATLGACVPPGFRYEVNDSVEVIAQYVVSANLGSLVEAQTITNQFATQTTGGALVAGCDNFSGAFILVGYYYTSWGPDEYAPVGCTNITISENYYLSIGNCCNNYAGGNIFEYEYRHWGIPGTARFIVPTGYSYVSSTMSYSRTNGTNSVNTASQAITPVAIIGDTIHFNMANLYTSNGGTFVLGDDGYYGTINVVLRPTCAVVPDVTVPIRYTWLFNPIPGLTGAGSVAANSARLDSINYESPSLSINPVLPTAPGLGSNVAWDFGIENNSNLAAANNAWFAFVSPSGLISPVTVTNLTTNAVINPVGGIYQFGNLLQDSSRTFRVRATYSNCAKDSIRVVTGWNCSGYPANLGSYPCQTSSAWLYIEPQPAVLQATMNLDPGPFEVCDSMLVELDVVSAQVAAVRDIQVQVTLPLSGGLTYGAGTAELRYPQLAAYGAVGNPTIVGNQLTWQINNISPVIATRNLPGIINPDSNHFSLRFYLYTDCNLISGDRIRVRVSGVQGCNDPVTPILLLSNPININGAVQPYTTQVAAQTSAPVAACPETKTITVNIVNSGALASTLGDSVFVSLGPGYSYAGGFAGLLHPPANSNPRIISSAAGLGLVWDMPTGMVAGDTMRFRFNVLVGDAVPCGPDLATVQTVTNQGLFCARTGSNCITSLQTGSTVLNLSVSRADLNFFGFSSTIQPIAGGNDYDYSGSIQNTGLPIAAGTTTEVRFYCDGDNSGGYSAGDALLGNYTTTAAIPNGGSHAFSGSILIPSASCPLSSMIYALITPNSAAGFCICDTAFANTNVVLPVEWLNVQADALPKANEVTWEATLTADHAHFIVEKLLGVDWRAVSDPIYDRGTAYRWLDDAPAATERYRIRATDLNGGIGYSRQVEVVRGLGQLGIRVYPNPASKVVLLEAPAGTRFTLVSALGVRLRAGVITSERAQALDLVGLAAGVYLLEFQWEDKQVTQRLVVE